MYFIANIYYISVLIYFYTFVHAPNTLSMAMCSVFQPKNCDQIFSKEKKKQTVAVIA